MADGFILFAPLNTKTTYLIDNCGREINSWQSAYFPGNTVYLMPNGNLLHTNRLGNTIIDGGGGGGGVEILDWDSNVLWTFVHNSDVKRQHHDVALLPNGNILVLVWDLISGEAAIAKGRDPNLLVDGVIWSEEVIEVRPILPDKFEVVWRWNAMDHLIQDFDQSKPNYGIVADHPERLNFNYVSTQGIDDWLHANSLAYNGTLDQVLVSSPFFNEVFIIDHSTTTEQAAGHSGGKSNKGGDLLWRWGNPATYKRGTAQDQRLFGQHHAHWIDKGLPHEGKIMIFNNNAGSNFSSVEIVDPLKDGNGSYALNNNRFGPEQANVTFKMNPPERMFSRIMSGAEMLPNGNMLIISSLQGKIFEVNSAGSILFEYKIPVTANGIVGRDYTPPNANFSSDPAFRCTRYPPAYPGFAGKNVTPSEPIEGQPWADCSIVTSAAKIEETEISVYPNPSSHRVSVSAGSPTLKIIAEIISTQGQRISRSDGVGELNIDISYLPPGIYVFRVNNGVWKIVKN